VTDYPVAPDLTLTAIGSGRKVSLGRPGVALVALCLAQETQKDADAIELAVRARWASAQDVLFVHVIDLRKVPGLFRPIAEGMMAGEYKKEVEKLPDYQALSPDDYVVILPDWEGAVATAFGIEDPAQVVGAGVISKDGALIGAISGPDGTAVIALVEKALEA
jgi:hypothetical protein